MKKSPKPISGGNEMSVNVTKHAVNAYRTKMFKWSVTDQDAKRFLETIAKKGLVVGTRPANAFEVRYNGLSIVACIEKNVIHVITFLGDKRYRQWSKKKEIQPRYQIRQFA